MGKIRSTTRPCFWLLREAPEPECAQSAERWQGLNRSAKPNRNKNQKQEPREETGRVLETTDYPEQLDLFLKATTKYSILWAIIAVSLYPCDGLHIHAQYLLR